MQEHCYESGWYPPLERPKRHRKGSFRRLAGVIGIARSTLHEKLKRRGFYKGKIRTGACDYCASYELHEQPLTEKIVAGFIERLRSMKSDCWDAWLQHVATANDCHLFTAANFERAGSPSYWEKCFQFLPQHCDPEGPYFSLMQDFISIIIIII